MLAFRLDGHSLARRSSRGSMLRSAGACGVQNTPPGSAALSLHARVEGLTPEDVENALEADKTLMQTFSLRGATYAFPTADAAVFTRGVLPVDEVSLRAFIQGAIPAFDKVGLSARVARMVRAWPAPGRGHRTLLPVCYCPGGLILLRHPPQYRSLYAY